MTLLILHTCDYRKVPNTLVSQVTQGPACPAKFKPRFTRPSIDGLPFGLPPWDGLVTRLPAMDNRLSFPSCPDPKADLYAHSCLQPLRAFKFPVASMARSSHKCAHISGRSVKRWARRAYLHEIKVLGEQRGSGGAKQALVFKNQA